MPRFSVKNDPGEQRTGSQGGSYPHKSLNENTRLFNRRGPLEGTGFHVEEKVEGWLQNSLIGRLREPHSALQLQDACILDGLRTIKVRALGDDLVLFSGEDRVNLSEAILGCEWIKTYIVSLKPWSRDEVPLCRVVWIRCLGLPLHL